MPQYDDKLTRFEHAIMKRANGLRDSLMQEINALEAQAVHSAEESTLQEEARRVKEETALLDEAFNREYAQKTAEYRREVLARRDEMTRSVFEAARGELEAFAASGKPYADWLCAKAAALRELCREGGAMLFLMERDRSLIGAVCAAFGDGCEGAVSEDFAIGGVILYHPASGLLVDESLDAALADQRNYFLEHSGLSLPPGAETR